MEPRTTNVEGEDALKEAGREVGVNVGFSSGHSASTLDEVILIPTTGAELNNAMVGSVGGGLVAVGFLLVVFSALRRRR